jgi:hypothetical protein
MIKRVNLTILASLLGSIALSCMGGCPATASSADDSSAIIQRAIQKLDAMTALLDALIAQAKQPSTANSGDGWTSLFDGLSLGAWEKARFPSGGDITVSPSFRGGGPALVVGFGDPLNGVNWTKPVPKTNYEVSLEAMRMEGGDFFCGLTFPVADSFATLVVGGWGGSTVGISSIDSRDASENETRRTMNFPKERWFRIRLRVTPAKLETWIDDEKIIDQSIVGRKISLRAGEIVVSAPFGLATYRTTAAFRNIRIRPVSSP